MIADLMQREEKELSIKQPDMNHHGGDSYMGQDLWKQHRNEWDKVNTRTQRLKNPEDLLQFLCMPRMVLALESIQGPLWFPSLLWVKSTDSHQFVCLGTLGDI